MCPLARFLHPHSLWLILRFCHDHEGLVDAATDLLDAQSTALTGIVGTVVDALRAGEGYRGNGGLSILCEKPQAVVMPALAKQCWTTLDRLDHSYDSAKKRNGATQERQATHEALNNGYSNRMPTQPPPFPFPRHTLQGKLVLRRDQ